MGGGGIRPLVAVPPETRGRAADPGVKPGTRIGISRKTNKKTMGAEHPPPSPDHPATATAQFFGWVQSEYPKVRLAPMALLFIGKLLL